MFRHFSLIWKSTLRNKRRTALTVLSIALSMSVLGLLMAIFNMFYNEGSSSAQANRLIVRNRVSLANVLPRSYQARIARVPGVKAVAIMQWFGGVYKDSRDTRNFFARFAVDADKVPLIYPEYQMPPDQLKAFVSERTACAVGNKLASRLGFQVGDRVTLVGDIFPVTLELTIRAIYTAERDNENLLFHYDYLNESLEPARRDFVGTFTILMDSPEDAPRIAQAVDAMFRNSPYQTKTETERQFELSFLAFLGNVKAFLGSISAAIMFTILLVSGNTMAMSVRERIREVGILKTLGFTNGKVLAVLMGESLVISLLGGLIGMTLTAMICAGLREAPSLFTDMSRLATPWWLLGACLAVAGCIGLISSLIPAWSAARRPILESLRVTD
ncbi:MAG: ABC transporter permease [Bryobacteraceae bacterium]|nr:ABC transporter permease [Bryobacteraceae bacterium]MDW8378179.1 FtsX-like permease family protein [Bryobacterales bacterium]